MANHTADDSWRDQRNVPSTCVEDLMLNIRPPAGAGSAGTSASGRSSNWTSGRSLLTFTYDRFHNNARYTPSDSSQRADSAYTTISLYLYITILKLNLRFKMENKIGEIAGVAEVTIKQSYRLMYPRAADLFPADFQFATSIADLPTS
uniref:Uncharacterized protein n=1 Tax=Romanomermis culicivorax TaxID=13658 RepID=A0A915KCQ0_ROMCU